MESSMTTGLFFSLLPLLVATFLDAADSSYFGGVSRVMETDLGLSMQELSILSMIATLATVLFLPVWGVIADRAVLSRKTLLVVSSAGWGSASILLAFLARGFPQIIILRFIVVAFLCSGLPITQVIIGSTVPPALHGTCFGAVGIAGSIGVVVSSEVSTAISEEVVFGTRGWRFGLVMIGIMSLVCSVTIRAFMPELPVEAPAGKANQRLHSGAAAIFTNLNDFSKIYSFVILCFQGCFGSFSYQVMIWQVMYFQYCGLSNARAGSIIAIGHIGGMFGGLIGGMLADALANRSPLHGRQFLAQCSVGLAVPIVLCTFRFLPREPQSYVPWCILSFLFFMSISMCTPGTNKPILVQLAPKHRMASMMSMEMTMEQLFGGFASAPLVALTTGWAGYHSSVQTVREMPAEQRQRNADALGFAISLLAGIGYSLVVLGYTLLHWTFPRDLAKCDVKSLQGAEMQSTQSKSLHLP